MNAKIPPPSPLTKFRFFLRRLREWIFLPILLLFLVYLGYDIHSERKFSAHVMLKEYKVTSAVLAPLKKLLVKQGSRVKKGQVIAQFDRTLTEFELQEATQEKQRLLAQCEKELQDLFITHANLLSRLLSLHRRARLELLQTKTSVLAWKEEITYLRKELQWMKSQQQKRFGRSSRLGIIEAKLKVLEKRVFHAPTLLRFYRTSAYETSKVKRIFQKEQKQLIRQKKLTALFQIQIKQQETRIKKLIEKKENLTIRSPINGIVHQLFQREGAHLQVGTELLSIIPSPSSWVIAYLPEKDAKLVHIGQKAMVSPVFLAPRQKRKQYKAIVRSLDVLSPIPLRFRVQVQKPRWVRKVSLEIVEASQFIAGERLQVIFRKEKK